ncbi:MAG TPA: hypothetical protein VGB69_12845 [Edaphobacter sp.]
MKALLRTLVVLLLLPVISRTASATPVTWTLQDVTFTDGASASGSFTIDLNKGQILNWDVVTTAGSSLAGFDYTPSTAYAYESSSTEIFFKSINPVTGPYGISSSYLFLYFQTPLTNAGGVIDLTTQSYQCDNCAPYRYVSGGYVTSELPLSAVPEPPSGFLVLSSVALIGVAFSTRRLIA